MSSNFTSINSKGNTITGNSYYLGYHTARNRHSRKGREIPLAPQPACWGSSDCEDSWFYLELRRNLVQAKQNPDPSTIKGPKKKMMI